MNNCGTYILEAKGRRTSGDHGIPFAYSPKLTQYLDGIQKEKLYLIGGHSSSGKRSFADLNFVLVPYLMWYFAPADAKPDLHILYFNLDKSAKMKLQKWLCTLTYYLQNIFIDVPTLSGAPSRLFNMTDMVDYTIDNMAAFMDTMLYSGVLEFFDGSTNPTGIRNDVAKFMRTLGGIDKSTHTERYDLDDAHKNAHVIVVIDNLRKLKNESRENIYYNEAEMHQKMVDYLNTLRDLYKVTIVGILPPFEVPKLTKTAQVNSDYKEYKYYWEGSNVVINLINPAKYNLDNYMGMNLSDYVTQTDRIAHLRAAHIMRNTDGRDDITLPYWFFPENGVMIDLPTPDQTNFLPTLQTLHLIKNNLIYAQQQSNGWQRPAVAEPSNGDSHGDVDTNYAPGPTTFGSTDPSTTTEPATAGETTDPSSSITTP